MLNNQSPTPAVLKGVACAVTTAQTDKTGATASNIVTLYTATAAAAPPGGGNGAFIQDITIKGTGTTAAATVCIFKNVSSTRYLIKEVLVTAITSSTTVATFDSGKLTINEFLAPGDKIDVLTTVTQTMHVSANVGEY